MIGKKTEIDKRNHEMQRQYSVQNVSLWNIIQFRLAVGFFSNAMRLKTTPDCYHKNWAKMRFKIDSVGNSLLTQIEFSIISMATKIDYF